MSAPFSSLSGNAPHAAPRVEETDIDTHERPWGIVLAGGALPHVQAPTLLIVGGRDPEVLKLNRNALTSLRCPAELVVIPGATHLFEEPGTLAEVSNLAAGWFRTHLRPRGAEEAREPLGVTTREE